MVQDCWTVAYKLIATGETTRAIEICETAPCSQVPECQKYLGWTFYKQDNWEKSLDWFLRAAEAEDGEALFGAGSVYFIQRDFQLALRYYQRAADRGYPRAYCWIAYIHHQGLGTPRNVDLAISCYEKAAACGFLVAERALIHLTLQRSTPLGKIAVLPKYLYVIGKAAILAYRNIDDPRISDVPNAFAMKRHLE
jgi:TPR repeat protein